MGGVCAIHRRESMLLRLRLTGRRGREGGVAWHRASWGRTTISLWWLRLLLVVPVHRTGTRTESRESVLLWLHLVWRLHGSLLQSGRSLGRHEGRSYCRGSRGVREIGYGGRGGGRGATTLCVD